MGVRKAWGWLASAVLVAGAAAATRADEGMWLFNRPPLDEIEARYGFRPDPAWLEHLQRSAVRISTGGSGSLVSPRGLVMTNHHVGSDILERLSTPERNLLEQGFLARTPADELAAPDLEMLVLWTIQDVTEQVEAPAAGLAAAEAGVARRKVMAEIEKDASERTGLHCEVVTLYQGGRYHLYCYKRYTEVKLVMAPAVDIAAFGGDVDNFEFPRWCLDMTFFRIYEDGKPLEPRHWLRFSERGVAEGDPVFVAGHPGSTQRMYTMDHLEYMRDVRMPTVLSMLWRAEVKLKNYSEDDAENARVARGELAGVQNSRKAYTGMLGGLLDPRMWAEKERAERELRGQIDANPEAKAKWAGAWERIAGAQAVAAELYPRYSAIGGGSLAIGGEMLGAAVTLVRLSSELEKPGGERLREFRDTNLDAVRMGLLSPAPVYPEFEIERLESGLLRMAEMLGGDDAFVLRALGGQSPRQRAESLVRSSGLADVATRQRLLDGGPAAIREAKDPLLEFVRELDADVRALRKRWEDEVQAVERAGYADIAAASFAILGEKVYPDATFTLRLSYGKVAGYTENGKRVEPFTTFEGLYQRHEKRKSESAFKLSKLWLDAKTALDLEVPFNFVSTNDIIGGNSGSPVVDRHNEVVGLIFDGNIHSLASNIAYSEEPSRAVSVDVRGIMESLKKVYRATELVEELSAKPLGQ